jgi:hypothetical protein
MLPCQSIISKVDLLVNNFRRRHFCNIVMFLGPDSAFSFHADPEIALPSHGRKLTFYFFLEVISVSNFIIIPVAYLFFLLLFFSAAYSLLLFTFTQPLVYIFFFEEK